MSKEVDAVVIGAGVAGSSMAYALARKGWDVALLDKGTFPRHKACGEFLSPESLASLHALELDTVVRTLQPATITKVRIHTDRGVSLEIPLPGPALGLSRHAFDARLQLSAKERGVSLYTGSPVSEVTAAGDGYLLESHSKQGNTRFYSRIVIGAYGRRPLNGLTQTRLESNKRKWIGIKSHFLTSDSSPVVDLYFFHGGYIGLSPIEGERLNVAALLLSSMFPNFEGSAAIQRILDNAAGRIPSLSRRLEGATPVPGTQAAAFPVTVRHVPTAWNEIPCIGDAVAVIPPFCGDGMAMALRSVELCAPMADSYLRGGCTKTEWRNSYSQLIKQQFSSTLRWGSLLERVLTHPILSSWLLRLGSIAPGTAERLVRATRLRG